jgi:hypothetical protein
MKTEISKDKLLLFLYSLKKNLKDGNAPLAYHRVCSSIGKIEEKEDICVINVKPDVLEMLNG